MYIHIYIYICVYTHTPKSPRSQQIGPVWCHFRFLSELWLAGESAPWARLRYWRNTVDLVLLEIFEFPETVPFCVSRIESASKMKPTIGVVEPKYLDDVSKRVPPTPQRQGGLGSGSSIQQEYVLMLRRSH